MTSLLIALSAVLASSPGPKQMHHYVFYGQNREQLQIDTAFFNTKTLEGAQVAYSWLHLEPGKDEYDFSMIREDLALLRAHGKKLFVQLQDVSFSPDIIPVPRYLRRDPYNGGVDKQYRIDTDEEHAVHEGWMTRRWDPAVQERLAKLLLALGKEFDGQIEGINLAESSATFGESGKLFPKGFTPQAYRDGIITNMRALKRAFPKSVTIEYGNFMPGEWRPDDDKGYLRAVYDAAKEMKVGVGGPDLLPYRRGQLKNSYPLIHDVADFVPVGIAVQDGDYDDRDKKTGVRNTVPQLIDFATSYLKADYIFWCTQQPYYSRELIPYMRAR